MIEYQSRTDSESKWRVVSGFQLIRLKNIEYFRFRFHGKLVEDRRYLNAALEREIIHARLLGNEVSREWLRQYKC